MHTALFMFDFYHNSIPSSFSNFFTSIRKVRFYNTRLSSSSAYSSFSTHAIIRTNYGKFSLRYLIIKDHLRGIPLIIVQKKLLNLTAKFSNKKSRHSFLKLTSEIRVSQNFKRHYQTLVLASRWLISFKKY